MTTERVRQWLASRSRFKPVLVAERRGVETVSSPVVLDGPASRDTPSRPPSRPQAVTLRSITARTPTRRPPCHDAAHDGWVASQFAGPTSRGIGVSSRRPDPSARAMVRNGSGTSVARPSGSDTSHIPSAPPGSNRWVATRVPSGDTLGELSQTPFESAKTRPCPVPSAFIIQMPAAGLTPLPWPLWGRSLVKTTRARKGFGCDGGLSQTPAPPMDAWRRRR